MTARQRALVVLAWVNVALHLAGLAVAAVYLRPGTPAVALEQRLEYLSARPLGWTIGWLVWTLCAVALVGFLAVLSRVKRSGLLDLCVLIAAGGAAADLLCNVLWVFVLPGLASHPPVVAGQYLTFERSAQSGGLILANGLYSFAILLASHGFLPGTPGARPVRSLGTATFLAGAALVAAGFTRDTTHITVATGATILAFCVWTVVVARVAVRLEPEV